MTNRFFQRRTVWWPTFFGWIVLAAGMGVPFFAWCFEGETFLSRTQRQPADTLIVEGWIGIEGIKAAKMEFERGGYNHIVATGGLTGNRWDTRRWSMATEADELLLRLGVPREQVILATPDDTPNHRTYEEAWAVRRALAARGLRPKTVNLFTFGVHARRSRLVYAKVQPSGTEVGVVSWSPPGYYAGQWWRSSERSVDLIKETVGWLFEALLNSGRLSNSTGQPRSEK